MKIRPIDKMLLVVERAADARGLVIEEDTNYMWLCVKLSDWDFGVEPTPDERLRSCELLRELFKRFELDFEQTLRNLILSEL